MTRRIGDPEMIDSAEQILARHRRDEHEDNIRSAVRDFLIASELFRREDLGEEIRLGSRPVDLIGQSQIFEFKQRLGVGNNIESRHVKQLDDYLALALDQGIPVRYGVLTDGRTWLLRHPGQSEGEPRPDDVFRLEGGRQWYLLYEWLEEQLTAPPGSLEPTPQNISAQLGYGSRAYRTALGQLRELRRRAPNQNSIEVKKDLWQDLLAAALGEAGQVADPEDLFLRHTYLSAAVGIAIHAAFGLPIGEIARNEPGELLNGNRFFTDTGIHGAINQGFFVWPIEVEGVETFVSGLTGTVSRFDWRGLDQDFARLLYESVISSDERRSLGEYYTPQWLADAIVAEVVTDPLNQSVLDPACGSGTFLWAALRHYLKHARAADVEPSRMLNWALNNIVGMDVHPLAVLLARATWLFGVQELLAETEWNRGTAVPVYLGDSLQLRTGYREGQLLGESAVVPIRLRDDERPRELRFPLALVEMGDWFDETMHQLAREIETNGDPEAWLASDPMLCDNEDMAHTARQLAELHREGRDHIWAYYTRNLVRPVALGRRRVDVILGNPPWINFNQTDGLIRDSLKKLSRRYGIWSGGRYATHQDIAGLFYAHCAHLYLAEGGQMGFVLPHSALQTGQWAAWRRGDWTDAASGRALLMDLSWKRPWDLEALEPNDFFPVASCVVFGRPADAARFADNAERWRGPAGGDMSRDELRRLFDTSGGMASPYGSLARQGATLVPRCLHFVEEAQSSATIRAPGTQVTQPRRGRFDKSPWKDLPLDRFHGMTVESDHVFDVHLGETLVPYATLNPLKAVLPARRSKLQMSRSGDGPGGVDPFSLDERVRDRWRAMARLWDENKGPNDGKSLLERIDYFGNLAMQFEWMRSGGGRIRVAYAGSGRPTAAVITDSAEIVDYKLFWLSCDSVDEANYLLAVINSDALYSAVSGLMSVGQFGPRDLQKHLWRLPIPGFDSANSLHCAIASAGSRAARGAAEALSELRIARKKVTVTIARREIRQWLASSAEGQAVESLVARLLESKGDR